MVYGPNLTAEKPTSPTVKERQLDQGGVVAPGARGRGESNCGACCKCVPVKKVGKVGKLLQRGCLTYRTKDEMGVGVRGALACTRGHKGRKKAEGNDACGGSVQGP